MRNPVNNGRAVRCVGKLFKSVEGGVRRPGRGEEGKWELLRPNETGEEWLQPRTRESSLFSFKLTDDTVAACCNNLAMLSINFMIEQRGVKCILWKISLFREGFCQVM